MGTTVRKISGIGGTRIVVRNRFTWAPGRSVSSDKLNGMGRVHNRSFKARFPFLSDVAMEYCWGGLLCLSWNNVAAFGEVDDGLYSACCQNGLGTAKGTLHGLLAAEQASGISSEHLTYMLNQPAPKKLPPEPFSSIGANAYLRWAEINAGIEL
jgi:glycine/D-amino acid oxidase-like deaminating enzyme